MESRFPMKVYLAFHISPSFTNHENLTPSYIHPVSQTKLGAQKDKIKKKKTNYNILLDS